MFLNMSSRIGTADFVILQLTHPRRAHLDSCKLSENEKAIQNNQQACNQQVGNNHIIFPKQPAPSALVFPEHTSNLARQSNQPARI